MTFVPIDSSHLNIAVQNDAQQWRSTIDWAQNRYYTYNQQLTTTIMTNLGVVTADQNAILAFIADLNNFNLLAAGSAPTSGSIFKFNVANILGIM